MATLAKNEHLDLLKAAPTVRERALRRELRNQKEALRKAKNELETRVAERTAELRQANEQLQYELAEHRRLEEALRSSEEKYRIVADSTYSWEYWISPRGRVLYCSPSCEWLTGHTAQALEGYVDLPLHIVHPDDLARCAAHHEEILQSATPSELEIRIVCRDGSVRWIDHACQPVYGDAGEFLGRRASNRDITERKCAEEFQQEYVSLISHDLRQPLSYIICACDLLRRFLSRRGLEREAQSAQQTVVNAKRMNSMIQDLVDTIRLEAGRLQLQRRMADLPPAVSSVLEGMGSPEDQARVRVESKEWVPPVAVDVDRLERVITNLVSNALKYSSQGTPITVQIGREGDQAVVSVRDQGPGIAAEKLPHVFDRFYRAKTGEKRDDGLGLGLYISRLIVEEHGGQIWAESTVGEGSTFSFSLPLA